MTQEKKENDKTTMENDEPEREETCRDSELPNTAEGGETEELVSCSDDLKADVEQKQTDLQDDEQPENDDIYQLPSLLSLVVQSHEGETCEGQFHGEGVTCFEGGHVYKGMFSEELMDGHGVFARADGLKYEGEFVCNMPMGQGAYTWLDGSSYKGEVFNGIRHGTGTHKCAKNVVSYIGQWDHSERHGKGTVYYNQDKTSWYKGDWVKNNREGWGVRHYPSGNIYSGEWKNNLRHGEGTMRWIKLQQQYDGMWQNGVQHGQGTHVWILKRADGSQYSQSNQYSGDFIQGLRHGHGTFYYAVGSIYEGEWRENKKHGKGIFTFEDGRVFEGEFVDDQMMTDDLNGNNAPAPAPPLPGKTEDTILYLPDFALNIECLLEKIPERKRDAERKQVELVVLRQARELRSVYSFYSRLGQAYSLDNTFLLSRLQLWRLLKDCNIHHHGITLTQIDHFIREDATTAEIHSPFTPMLLRKLISCLVVVAYHIYHMDMVSQNNLLADCFSKLMTDNILPNSKNVKGFLFRQPDCGVVAESYLKKCWEVYQAYCRVNAAIGDQTMTCRHLLWMFKDLHLLDNNLTTARLLQIITAESHDRSNPSSCLDLEITFLEFFEVLLGSAEVKFQQVSGSLEECQSPSSPDAEARTDLSPVEEAIEEISQTINSPSRGVAAPANSPVSLEISRTELLETSDTAELSTAQDVVSQQEVEAEVNEEPLYAEHAEEPSDEEMDMQTREMEVRDREVELWEQTIHQFFNHFFFPAVKHYQLVSRKMKEEKLCQEAHRRIALAKAQQRAASLTGQKDD